jgi:hypothetical protein
MRRDRQLDTFGPFGPISLRKNDLRWAMARDGHFLRILFARDGRRSVQSSV